MTEIAPDGQALPALITTGQAAQILGVSRQRVRALMRHRKLDATAYGRNYLITRESLQEWIAKREYKIGISEGRGTDALSLMRLPYAERRRALTAAGDAAAPAYEADHALLATERVLTADLETGTFHDYDV